MKTETYALEDIKLEIAEHTDEAIALCEQLGMEGQLKLVVKNDSGDAVARFPYRLITDEERFVFKILCPEASSLKDYRNEAVPVEVLREIKRAREAGIETFEIWSASSRLVKDPVVVGRKQGSSSWSTDQYLIARWGDELLPLAVLLPDAIKKFNDERTGKLKTMLAQLQAAIAAGPIAPSGSPSMPYMSL